MRLVRTGVPTAVVFALLALLPHLPATAAPSPPPAFCDIDGHIIPGTGIGQLTLNQPVEDARRLLDAGGVPPTIDGSWVTYTSGPNSGVGYFARGKVIQVIVIFIPTSSSLTTPPVQRSCRTPDGLGLLSREQDILAVYGPTPRVYRLTRSSHPELHPRWLIYDDRGLTFGVVTTQSDSVVATVYVFAPGTICAIFPQVCSP